MDVIDQILSRPRASQEYAPSVTVRFTDEDHAHLGQIKTSLRNIGYTRATTTDVIRLALEKLCHECEDVPQLVQPQSKAEKEAIMRRLIADHRISIETAAGQMAQQAVVQQKAA